MTPFLTVAVLDNSLQGEYFVYPLNDLPDHSFNFIPFFYYLTQTSTVKTKNLAKYIVLAKYWCTDWFIDYLKWQQNTNKAPSPIDKNFPAYDFISWLRLTEDQRESSCLFGFLGFFVHFVQRETHSINTFCPPLPCHIGLSPVTWNMSIKCKIKSASFIRYPWNVKV